MSIVCHCGRCTREIDTPGAILFGPPLQWPNPPMIVTPKTYLCGHCYLVIMQVLVRTPDPSVWWQG